MLKEHKIKDPIYQSSVSLLVGGNEAELYKFLRRRHGEGVKITNKESGENAEASCDPRSASTDGIQFHVNEDREHFYAWIQHEDIDALFHEVMHLTFDVLTCRGIQYDDSCEDAFCYWGAAVFAQAYQKIFNH